jgi:AcrR family transcriptional regulator
MAQGSADGRGGAGQGSTAQNSTAQNSTARREQLLRSALEVIVARGYADTRIADVAEHAGTSPALVIYYFKTRDQLLTEALRYSEDAWYAAGTQRLAAISTAVGRLTELIAMTCLPDTDPAARTEWLLWLDLWALSPRNPGVATVRRKFDERWRETISSTVLSGQEAGEFSTAVDAAEFAVTLSALLDGMAVQIALEDPDVPPARAYDLAMRYAAGQLGFDWESPASGRAKSKRGKP